MGAAATSVDGLAGEHAHDGMDADAPVDENQM